MPVVAILWGIIFRGFVLKVLSIVRFRPKPNHLEDVIKELRLHNQRCRELLNQQRFLTEIEGEIYLVKISPSIEKITEDQEVSLTHLESIRHWLDEWSVEERQTRSISGMLIDE